MVRPTCLPDVDRCLIHDSALLKLSNPDAAGLLYKRSNLSGWYKYWFSLSGSQLLYFERADSGRRGLLIGTISLFRHKLTIVNSIKRRRELEITETAGKLHVLRAETDGEMHWWVQVFGIARNKIPPAKPISRAQDAKKTDSNKGMPSTIVDCHLRVDHVLCVVHGIGVSSEILASNTRELQTNYEEIMDKVFPDIEFRMELLVIHWRDALTTLDVHKRLQAVVPRAPVSGEGNPLRQFMVHRIVDYVYYTHERYRQQILREIASQLNRQYEDLRRRRPDFNGKISVMGHSLGAALIYDLMCRKVHDDQVLLESEGLRLKFDATNLFCVGNPLGTLLGLDPTIGMGADMMKLPFRIFNVFKYHDPVATRLEPCRDLASADVGPVVVPCWLNMGLRETTSQWLGGFWTSQKKKGNESDGNLICNSNEKVEKDNSENIEKTEDCIEDKLVSMGGNGIVTEDLGQGSSGRNSSVEDCEEMIEETGKDKIRLDFVLQMSSTMEEVSTSWSALKAHTEYWGNRDAMLLMVSQMVKSSFEIGDVCPEVEMEVSKRVIDENVLRKRYANGGGEKDGGSWCKYEHGSLEMCVEELVEEIVEQVVANQTLLRRGDEEQNGRDVLSRGKGKVTEVADRSSAGSSGWAAYLGASWFGGEQRRFSTDGTAIKQGTRDKKG